MILSLNAINEQDKPVMFSKFVRNKNGYASKEMNEDGKWRIGIAKNFWHVIDQNFNVEKLLFLANIKPVVHRGVYFIELESFETIKKIYDVMTKPSNSRVGEWIYFDEANIKEIFKKVETCK